MKLEKLQERRKAKGFTRKELSEFSGVSVSTIEFLELGYYDIEQIKLGTLVKLAKVLHCKILDLLDDKYRRIIK